MSDGEDDAYEQAIRLLARREHSQFELRQKLWQREQDDAAIDEALERLFASGLQSDERFAESFVRARVSRGQGPVRISAEFAKRGVDKELAQQALYEADVDWRKLAAEVRERRFGEAVPDTPKARAKQQRFLAQRGFPADIVYGLFDMAD